MDRNFPRALQLVLKHEGGYVDHPRDPGGATNLGITLDTLSSWRGRRASKADVKALTVDDVTPIYRKRYWDAVSGDLLPSGLDYAVFDYGVNSGPSRAAKHLQAVLGVAQDGKIGPVTIAAAREADIERVIEQLCAKRLAFLKGLPTWGTFGKGWERRVNGVLEDALLMAVSPVPPADDIPHHPEQPQAKPPARMGWKGWLAIAGFLLALLFAFLAFNLRVF